MPRSEPSSLENTSMSLIGTIEGGLEAGVADPLAGVLSLPGALALLGGEFAFSPLPPAGSVGSEASPPPVAFEVAGLPPGATLTETVGDAVLVYEVASLSVAFDLSLELMSPSPDLPAPEPSDPESFLATLVAST